MSAARRMRIFAWSLPISGLVAGYGSLLILWSLDDLVSTMLHRYPAFVVLALATPLMVILVALSQWLLGVRLTRIDGQFVFTDAKAARSAGGDSPDMPFPGTRR